MNMTMDEGRDEDEKESKEGRVKREGVADYANRFG